MLDYGGRYNMHTYHLKISLLEADFPFSRTVMVADYMNFSTLNEVIETVFGFGGETSYQFARIKKVISDEDELNEHLNKGLEIQYVHGVWHMSILVKEQSLGCLNCPTLIDYEWGFQLPEIFNEFNEYLEFIEKAKNNPDWMIEDEDGMLEPAENLIYFDKNMINAELTDLFEVLDDSELDDFYDNEMDPFTVISQIIKRKIDRFDIQDQLVFIKEEACWIWIHNGENGYTLYSKNLEEIAVLWNASRKHEVIDERYFTGLLIIHDSEENDFVFDYSGHVQHCLEKEEERYYLDMLEGVVAEVLNADISNGIEMKEQQYMEISDGRCSISQVSLELSTVEQLPVTARHEELKQKPKGKEKLNLVLDNISDESDEGLKHKIHLLVKGRHFHDFRIIYSSDAKGIAKEIDQYLCEYIQDHPRPKVVTLEDNNVTVYLKDIFSTWSVRLNDVLMDKCLMK